MKQSQNKKINPLSVAFILILIYFTFLNLFIIKATPELIALQFIILIFAFKRLRTKEFIKIWLPFIALFFLYEFLRGFADNLSPFYSKTLYLIFDLETNLFGKLPTLWLQEIIGENKLIINISIFFYSMFFYYSFLAAFLLWLYKNIFFKTYMTGFLFLSFVGILFFFLMPTAPPWMASDIKNLGIERYIFLDNTIVFGFKAVSLWNYLLQANPVAAFPSLHVAWPAFTSLFLIINLKSRWKYLLLIIPVMIGFSIVLTGEHYILDVAFGWALAMLSIFASSWLIKRLNQTDQIGT